MPNWIIPSLFLNLICVFSLGVTDPEAPRISLSVWAFHRVGAAIDVAQPQFWVKGGWETKALLN